MIKEKITMLKEQKNVKPEKQLSELIFDIIQKMEERDKIFENKIEKIDKNIESILKILIKKDNRK